MVVHSETRQLPGDVQPPAGFVAAVEGMRTAAMRAEVSCEAIPAPQRIAPHSYAVSADVTVDDEEVGTGRLILLHDPAGNDAWHGTYRLVAYVRTEIDPELAIDPMLSEVGWTWLTEALTAHGADWGSASGTVTRVATESFGGMAEEDTSAQIEIRASWTPQPDAADPEHTPVRAHVEAWGELLCTAAGLPPVPEGVTAIPSRRGQRGN